MMLNPFANVAISVSGLAVCHYNSESNNWEFLLPRDISDHKLKIVFTKHFKDGRKTERLIPVSETLTEISVATEDKFEPTTETKFRFAGGQQNDGRDARWILDIIELYKNNPVKLANKNKKRCTFLSIPAGTIYNSAFPKNPNVRIECLTGSTEKKVAQIAGIDIQWAAGKGKTTVKDSNNNNFIPELLRDDDVALYEVKFDNDCSSICVGEETDFKHYNTDLIEMNERCRIFSINDNAISSIEELFMKLLGDNVTFRRCRDAPCFLIECSKLDGIKTLKELLP